MQCLMVKTQQINDIAYRTFFHGREKQETERNTTVKLGQSSSTGVNGHKVVNNEGSSFF